MRQSMTLTFARTAAVAAAVSAGAFFISNNTTDAAILPVGTAIPAVATAADPTLGVFVDSTGALPYAAATFSGTLTEEVRQEAAVANPLGGLTFIYQVTSDAVSLTDVERMTTFNFAGWTVDATYFVSAGGQQPPVEFTRSGGAGHVIGADFALGGGALNPGESTALLVLRTNAPSYVPGINSVIDGGTATVRGFAPIPEPGALTTVIVALAAALLRRTRKQQE